MLVNVLLVVGDDRLGDGLADSVDLRGVTTTGDADADVDTGELVSADDQERLVDLVIRRVRPQFQCCRCALGCCNAVAGVLECEKRTLKRRISGWTRLRGWPLTLTRPLPCYKSKSLSMLLSPSVSRAPCLPRRPTARIISIHRIPSLRDLIPPDPILR